jgi:hypothetical protein
VSDYAALRAANPTYMTKKPRGTFLHRAAFYRENRR